MLWIPSQTIYSRIQGFNFGGFPGSSAGKEYTYSAGDPGLIPGLGRSPGEGIGYPLQYSWASLVAQLVRSCLQCRRPGFDPCIWKMPWRRERLPTPVFWPGEFHGLYSQHDWVTFTFWKRGLGNLWGSSDDSNTQVGPRTTGLDLEPARPELSVIGAGFCPQKDFHTLVPLDVLFSPLECSFPSLLAT